MGHRIRRPIQTLMELSPIRPFQAVEQSILPTDVLALYKIRGQTTLKNISKIDFTFDPFHPSVATIRDLMVTLATKKIKRTNVSCLVRTSIVCDRSEPKMRVQLSNGEQFEYRTANLKELEVLQHLSDLTAD